MRFLVYFLNILRNKKKNEENTSYFIKHKNSESYLLFIGGNMTLHFKMQ